MFGAAQQGIQLISIQVSIANEWNFDWGKSGQSFVLVSIENKKLSGATQLRIGLKEAWTAQDRIGVFSIQIRFENKRKLFWGSPGQNHILLSIENERKLLWERPRQNLIDFYSHFN